MKNVVQGAIGLVALGYKRSRSLSNVDPSRAINAKESVMKNYFSSFAVASILLTTVVSVQAAELSPQEAKNIGVDAYIYGYSLLTSDITGRAFTNVAAPSPATLQAPINQFVSVPKYPPADYKGVTAPDADTLYSAAFLDVSKEPIMLSYPDLRGRYFLFPIYSQWTNVIAAPGKRTLGTKAQTIAIIGPNFGYREGDMARSNASSHTGSGYTW
jgi:hypothetical protein